MPGFDVENELGFHPGTPEVTEKFEQIRENFMDLAVLLNELLPESRHKSLALTNLQQAQMWAIGGVAINETPLA